MDSSLDKTVSLNEVIQNLTDKDFVDIVGHLTDIGVQSERIVTLYDLEK
jgi:hypothetical protein